MHSTSLDELQYIKVKSMTDECGFFFMSSLRASILFFFRFDFFFAVFALAQTPEHLSNRKIITEFYSVCPNLHRLQFVFLSC